MSEAAASFFGGLAKSLKGEIARSRENLVPAAFQFLWEVVRFLVAYGGRASGKSWSIARVLVVLASETPLRILCVREIQGSIKESAYRLLSDQIDLLGLSSDFEIQADCIIGRNGSRFYFEGLRYNTSRIRSYEGIDICWVEEAQSVSEMSWETLLPTIRKPGSRFFISFNPLNPDDPVLRRFVNTTPPGCIAHKVSYRDNPHLSAESEAERQWLESTDEDSYRHVWLGEARTVSDALILKGKFVVESFDVQAHWAGPYHGLDYGFSRDPAAGIRCYIDDANRVLYVAREFWRLACDIDVLPAVLEDAIPGVSTCVVYCDSARPETTSYLARNGIANARSADKWPGSVNDGVMYLRSFARIVVDPSCVHMIDECRSYSFKTDRLTGVPLPEVEDKHNHCIDALRYALWPLIRNQAPGGYFSRAALLVGGEAVADIPTEGRPLKTFGVLSTTDRVGSSAGLVVLAYSPHYGWPLTVLGYDLVEVETALDTQWLAKTFTRMQELNNRRRALANPELWVERADSFGQAVIDLAWGHASDSGALPLNVCVIEKDILAPTLDQRAAEVKTHVNGGKHVKLARSAYTQLSTFRSNTTNHLIAQLLGYRPEVRDASQELVNAFCTGILISIERNHI